MSVGTPNFVGERLKEAREARGLSGVALADLVGVGRASISLYELGKASPQFDVLVKLASVLNVPQAFFIRPVPELNEDDDLFYRSMASATKLDRVKAKRRYAWLKHVTSYLRGFVRFPAIKVPNIDSPSELYAIDSSVIINAARDVRKAWGLGDGPISDVTLLLENNGVIVSKVSLGTMYMDGFAGWDKGSNTPYIMLGDDKGSAVRSRFDVAHELGHLILHKNLPSEYVKNPIYNKQLENHAHKFASAFLMPEETFCEDLYVVNLDALKALKSKWLVSIGAMLYRAQELELTNETQSRRLWQNYVRRGWRKNEPLDNELKAEYPRLLRRAFELIVNRGVHPPAQIVSDLCLSSADIRELSGMAEGFLENGGYIAAFDVVGLDNNTDLGITEAYEAKHQRPPSLN